MRKFRDFKKQYYVPKIFEKDDYAWDSYCSKLRSDNLISDELTHDTTYSNENVVQATYLSTGTIAFAVGAFAFGYIWGWVLVPIAWFLTYLLFLVIDRFLFVVAPYCRYLKFINKQKEEAEKIEKEKQEAKKIEEEALLSGDLTAKYKYITEECHKVDAPENIKVKLNGLLEYIEIMIDNIDKKPALSQQISRYMNIYMEEILRSLEKNTEILETGNGELYEKYLKEIDNVIDKMTEIFYETIQRISGKNALSIDSTLKAVSQMLDSEKRGSDFNDKI